MTDSLSLSLSLSLLINSLWVNRQITSHQIITPIPSPFHIYSLCLTGRGFIFFGVELNLRKLHRVYSQRNNFTLVPTAIHLVRSRVRAHTRTHTHTHTLSLYLSLSLKNESVVVHLYKSKIKPCLVTCA